MRALLATAFLTAGCLHAQGPGSRAAKADPATLHAFELLVNDADTIDDAAHFAVANGLRREDWIDIADRAYWSFYRSEIYPPAAEIAWRFKFPERAVMFALDAQRKDYDRAGAIFLAGKGREGSLTRLHVAQWELSLEIRIACRYAPKKAAEETVGRAVGLKMASDTMSVLYPLLDEGCPVDGMLRNSIIDYALLDDKDDYAIRHGAASDWDDVRKSQFLWHFFYNGDCTDGVKALTAFKLTVPEGARIIENANCEDEIIDARGWKLESAAADSWFFAAVRGKKYNLALELLPLSTHGEDGEVFLWQEAVRAAREDLLIKALNKHVGYHDRFMAYLWERGRYRFIANFSLTLDWQRKAFDKLLELGKWEDAAEAAEYGISESLKKEGVLLAFRAAMAAGDFKSGRYFVYRYGPVKDKPGLVTQEMYDQEKDKFYASKQASGDPEWMKEKPAKPKPKARKKRVRQKPPCPDGDWCP